MKYLGLRNTEDALDLFSEMSIGIAPSTKSVTRFVASPIKIYDYMACCLPIVTADCGEWAEHVRENDCGLVTKNSSADEFLWAVDELQDKNVWEQKSENAVEAIRTKFNWDAVLTPIRDVLQKY
jgi:glycosyltransferase involved in cell wall biosynthesis